MIFFLNFFYLHTQQTPYPDAQLPSLVPPLLEHSSLNAKILFFWYTDLGCNRTQHFSVAVVRTRS